MQLINEAEYLGVWVSRNKGAEAEQPIIHASIPID